MTYSLIFTGLGLATAGFTGKFIASACPKVMNLVQQKLRYSPATFQWSKIIELWNNAKYYRGGFENKMTKTEAYRILGVSSIAPEKIVNAKYKQIMMLNHPDRGGSPYLAFKINEAKDIIHKMR